DLHRTGRRQRQMCIRDSYNTLVVAQKEARALVAADPDLLDPGHKALKQVLEYKQLEQNRI
ncbi:hypothetical protein, partial [Lactobacillus crispatus]|uniref:hypothetical protein n=1 Tax=Lactobacillus crispatus TaxID=47770 RepID=UPI001F0960C9